MPLLPVIVWVGGGIAAALVVNEAAEAVEDTSDAGLKLAAAGAVAVGAYLAWKHLR